MGISGTLVRMCSGGLGTRRSRGLFLLELTRAERHVLGRVWEPGGHVGEHGPQHGGQHRRQVGRQAGDHGGSQVGG